MTQVRDIRSALQQPPNCRAAIAIATLRSAGERLCDLTKRYEQAARVCERVEEDVGPAQGPRLYGIGMLGAIADVANRLFSGCKNAIQAWPW